MGTCFHIAGVSCDNCRTGGSVVTLHPLTNTPLTGDVAGSYPPPLATAAEVAVLRADIVSLKAEVERLKAALPCPFHSDGKHRCVGCGDIP